MSNLAPVVLFVYNRPEHTRQTLEALSKNDLADQSVLYIFADGPKADASDSDLKRIDEVRQLIYKQDWCELYIAEARENLGLAQSVIKGVTQIVNKHGKVIVLEDDVVTHPIFLQALNTMLEIYAKEPTVYGVTGYKFPSNSPIGQATYFLPVMSSWGYGTWKDKWNQINFDAQELLDTVRKKRIGEKLRFGRFDFLQMLNDQVAGRVDSWAVRFYVSMRLKNGVFLFPNKSLIQNIGFDGSGVHSGVDRSALSTEDVLSVESCICVEKKTVVVNRSILRKFRKKGRSKSSLKKKATKRLKRILKKLFAPELLQLLKRKLGKAESTAYGYLEHYPRFTELELKLLGKTIRVPDAASFIFMYREIFEVESYKFHTQNQHPRIIDAGANIGLATIYFKQQFPDAHIIAFEPDPQIMKVLRYNIDQFQFQNVELHQVGLWDKEEQLAFHSEGADGGHIIQQEQSTAHTIKVTSLRSFLKQKTDFLKMDIEGAETRVLEDVAGSLNLVERIFIEYHSFTNEVQTLGSIVKILEDAGFRYHVNSPGLTSKQPFVKTNKYNGMDMQLNIYGFKD